MIRVPRVYKPLFDDNWQTAFIYGGRWGLKTYQIALYILDRMVREDGHIIVARQFQNSIRDSNYSVLTSIINGMPQIDRNKYNISKTSIQAKKTGSTIVFLGIERNINSIRSFNDARVLWIDESHFVSEEAFNVIEPTIRYPNSKFIYSWNPHMANDAIEKRLLNRGKDDLALFINWYDIDENFLTNEFYQAKEKTERIYPHLFNHTWNGDYLPFSAYCPFSISQLDSFLSLPPFSAQNNNIFAEGEERELYAGVDLAWTNNEGSDYTAIVVGDGNGNVIEATKFRTDDNTERKERILEAIKDCHRVFIDTTGGAGAGLSKELRNEGLTITNINYTQKKKVQHLENCIYMLGYDKLHLDGQVELIDEMKNYHRSPDGLRSEAVNGHFDDLVSALLLYCQCVRVQKGL